MQSRRRYEVRIPYSDQNEITLHFPMKTEGGNGDPVVSMIAFETLLEAKYPKLKFDFDERYANEMEKDKEKEYFKDTLVIKGNIPMLCALHELACSQHFYQMTHANSSFKDRRDHLIEAIRKEMQQKLLSADDEMVIARSIIESYNKEAYDGVINTIASNFVKIAAPTELQRFLENIQGLHDPEFEFQFPKYTIVLAKLCQLRNELEVNPETKKQSEKIIAVYNNILTHYGFYDSDRYQRFMNEYKKHEDAIKKKLNESVIMQQQIAMQKNLLLDPAVVNLKSKIQAMMSYGEGLKSQKIKKGGHACDVAENLQTITDQFFGQDVKEITEDKFAKFKENFTEKLNEKNDEMKEYRLAWGTLLKNIGIALTGVGALVIAGKLLYSGIKDKRPLLLFAQKKTTCEQRRDEINGSLGMIRLPGVKA